MARPFPVALRVEAKPTSAETSLHARLEALAAPLRAEFRALEGTSSHSVTAHLPGGGANLRRTAHGCRPVRSWLRVPS